MMQPIQITKSLKPIELHSPKPGTYVYDFGQNFTGYVKLNVFGLRGSEVKLRFAELVYEDGNIIIIFMFVAILLFIGFIGYATNDRIDEKTKRMHLTIAAIVLFVMMLTTFYTQIGIVATTGP